MNWIAFSWVRITGGRFCEQGNEPAVVIKTGVFLICMNILFSRGTALYGVR
jgi:hypothetical protein